MDLILDDFDEYGNKYLPDFKLLIREFASGVVEMVQRPVDKMAEMRRSMDHGIRGASRPKTQEEKDACFEENLRRAERRARQKIRHLIYTIKADHLLTLTYRENMTDSDRLNDDFKEFMRLVRKRYPDYQYVAVKEYQDRGALHMHVACVGKQDVKYLRKCWYQSLGGSGEEVGEDSPGAINVQFRQKRFSGASEVFNYVSLAGYLCKYISKTFAHDRELGERRYKASRHIPPPKIFRTFLAGYAIRDGEQAFAIAMKSTLNHADFLGVRDYQIWNDLSSGVLILRGHV